MVRQRGREPEGQMVWLQDRVVQVQADSDQALGEAAEVPEVGDQAPAGRELGDRVAWVQDQGDRVAAARERGRAGRVPVDQAEARKDPVVGLEPVTMAEHPLSRGWSPVSRGDHPVGAASLQKKNFSGFSEL